MTVTVGTGRQTSAAHRDRDARLESLPFEAAGPTRGFVRGTVQSVRDVWGYRDLLNLLFRRELKARYKDSSLGFVWSLLRPLAQLAVYAIAIGKFLGAARGGNDYPIFVFAGLTIWQLFAEIVALGTSSIVTNGALVKKIYLPREVFTLSVVGSALFNFLMQLCVLVVGTFAMGSPPRPESLGYAALAIAIALVWGTALAFVLAAVNVYLRDVQYLVEIFLMWGMWLCPIVYSWALVAHEVHHSWFQRIYLANPMTLAVLGFQRGFWRAGKPTDTIGNLGIHMAIVLGIGLVLLWVCQRIFARLEANFAQEL
jgi:ABC-2 type transport system permease protein